MPKRKLKMTKTAIAARRRYRKKKHVGGCAACKAKKGRRRRRRPGQKGAGFFEDVGSFISNAAQTVLPMLPMIL